VKRARPRSGSVGTPRRKEERGKRKSVGTPPEKGGKRESVGTQRESKQIKINN